MVAVGRCRHSHGPVADADAGKLALLQQAEIGLDLTGFAIEDHQRIGRIGNGEDLVVARRDRHVANTVEPGDTASLFRAAPR